MFRSRGCVGFATSDCIGIDPVRLEGHAPRKRSHERSPDLYLTRGHRRLGSRAVLLGAAPGEGRGPAEPAAQGAARRPCSAATWPAVSHATRTTSSTAAHYYNLAHGAGAPGNDAITGQAFEMSTMHGDFPRATALAKQLVDAGTDNRLARVMVGLTAFKAGKFAEAEEMFKTSGGNPVSDLDGHPRPRLDQAGRRPDQGCAGAARADARRRTPSWPSTAITRRCSPMSPAAARMRARL